jgi:ribokinase
VALIFVAETGENSIIVAPGANNEFRPEGVSADMARLQNFEIVLLQLENPVESVWAAAQKSKELGARVILDPAPAPATPLPKQLMKLVDVLTPNETEAALLAGLRPGCLSVEEARSVGAKLQAMGATTVILKLGERGCLLVEQEQSTLIPAPRVTAVDTTAAGDVFNGALAVALGERSDLKQACRFAVYASALSVTRVGTQTATPSRAEVDEFAAGCLLDGM